MSALNYATKDQKGIAEEEENSIFPFPFCFCRQLFKKLVLKRPNADDMRKK
jgi:hypothetical protein